MAIHFSTLSNIAEPITLAPPLPQSPRCIHLHNQVAAGGFFGGAVCSLFLDCLFWNNFAPHKVSVLIPISFYFF